MECSSKKIIQYYNNGYSQKDIHALTKMPVSRIRSILALEGFETSSYRSISKEVKDIIELLVYEGYSYREISNILDISFHVIREISEIRDLDISNKSKFNLDGPVKNKLYSEFLSEYINGKSFLSMFFSYEFAMADVPFLANNIMSDNNIIAGHKEKLSKSIICLLNKEYPVNVIAKKLNISVSFVKKEKKLLNEKGS